MKRPDFQETWNALMDKLIGLGEPILGKKFLPELQQALGELEAFRCLLNYSNDAIFLVDPHSGKIEKVNDTACRLLDLERETLHGMPLEEVAGPDGKEALRQFLSEMEGGHPEERTLSVEIADAQGAGVPLEISLQCMSEYERSWLVVVARNVSDQKQAEATLQENHRQHMNTLDALPDLLYELAPDGTILYVNRAASRTLGISQEDLGKIKFSDFLEGAEVERWSREIHGIVDKRHQPRNVSYNLKTTDGNVLPVEARDTLQERAGRAPTVLGVARDITDRKQLEERILRSQRMEALGRLSGGIAHEYNNLMTAITGHAELMMLDLQPGDPLRKRAEEIQRAGALATDLTRQLLTFNRKQVLQPSPVRLNDVVSQMEKMLRRLIGEDIDLVIDLSADIGMIRADRAQIEQAILNLAVNSREAMPDGGTVTIETCNVDVDATYASRHVPMQPGAYVMLVFSDTGAGMGPEVQSHIFEPFFTTREQEKRTGMGLSTVYGIVRQSGGYIWVYSEPDLGTTFKLYLPRTSGQELPAPSPPPPAPRDLQGSETVLLVEDLDSIRELACEVLQGKGYKVLSARNAGEALLISEQHTGLIHLMLTDMVMPRMGGRELAERLQPWHPEMKVLYMSGYTETDLVRKGLQQAGASFLEKPFSPQALARKVREVLNDPRSPSDGPG
jgi:PAS domain S-box-containing protein